MAEIGHRDWGQRVDARSVVNSMDVATLAGALGVIASIVSTTMIVVGKLTRVEVMLAELRAQMTGYEHRIAELERRMNDQP